MIDYEKIKDDLLRDIAETKEYGYYLENTIQPLLTAVGVREYQQLKFFNIGYQYALENILIKLSLEHNND